MWKDIVKKNAISIACGVVALIALIASIWPADGWVAELQEQLDSSQRVGTTLNGLATKSRNLPNLDPNSTEPIPLKQFPSKTIIEQGKAATEEMKVVSQKLFDEAVKVNQRPLLVPGSLPRSGDVKKLEFRGAYALAFAMQPGPRTPQLPEFNVPVSILKATQPPTAEEITAAQDALWQNTYVPKIVLINNQPANAQQVQDDFVAEAMRLPDLMRQQKAERSKIYMMPGALTENTSIGGSGVPKEDDIWAAQLGLWIQQDVAQAIAATNANSKQGIIDAPVKQLIQLTVPQGAASGTSNGYNGRGGFGGPGFGPMGGGEEGGAGAKVSDPTEALTFDYTTTPTGRVKSGLYDVHEFVLVVDVEAAQLSTLINELTRNRYVAIHSVNMEPVDLKALQAAGFMYGSRPVVRVTLQCEMLYLRKWTEPFMPDNVKALLGIAPPPAPGA